MLRNLITQQHCRTFTSSSYKLGKILTTYKQVPEPTSTVPDVETFLTKIGRNSIEHAKHFESWNDLFTKTGQQLKESGIDTRERRYILNWCERYRQGFELNEYKRGVKKWGGERRAKENKAVFYGRQRAEQRAKSA